MTRSNHKSNLKRQIATHEDAQKRKTHQYRCEHDKYNFSATSQTNFRSHIEVHHTPGRTRNFECLLCPAKFYNQSARIVTHLNEKQFKCSLCKSYDRSNLRVHIKAVHEKITHFGFQSKWKGVDWQKVLVLCHPFQNVPKFSEISESASFRCLPKPSTAYSTTIHSSNRRKANVEVEVETLK